MKGPKGLFVFALVLCLAQLCAADGMVYVEDNDVWSLRAEDQQVAAINYQNGYEHMLVTVGLKDEGAASKAVWIFPVPVSPNKVSMGVAERFPSFPRTSSVNDKLSSALAGVGMTMIAYDTFPVGIAILFPVLLGFLGGISFGATEGVTVYETMEKLGVRSELVTAKSGAALGDYLEAKGFSLPPSSARVFDSYAGKDYSLVVTYVSDVSKLPRVNQAPNIDWQRWQNRIPLTVALKFPTDRMYFPLKPTGAYGEKEIPIVIYVVGHATPELYPEIKDVTKVDYYYGDLIVQFEDRPFFGNPDVQWVERPYVGKVGEDFAYTRIKIIAPSYRFTDDLWIDQGAPASVGVKKFLTDMPWWLWCLFLMVPVSALSGIIAGALACRDPPEPRVKLAVVGLTALLTFIGVIIAAFKAKLKHKAIFLFLYVLAFIGLTVTALLAIWLMLGLF